MLYILNIGTEHTEFVVLAKVYKTAKEPFLNDTITKKTFIKVLSIKKILISNFVLRNYKTVKTLLIIQIQVPNKIAPTPCI